MDTQNGHDFDPDAEWFQDLDCRTNRAGGLTLNLSTIAPPEEPVVRSSWEMTALAFAARGHTLKPREDWCKIICVEGLEK